jgi:TetR/AcrR family transcriptional regulator
VTTSSPIEPRGPGRPAGDRKGHARAALLAAARALMTEKGLTRVTAREVADRADLNPGLVRYYFGSKNGLLRAVVSEIAREGQERTREWSDRAGDASERLRGLIASMIRSFAADPYAARLYTEQVFFADDAVVDHFVDEFGRAHIGLLREILDDGVASGDFRALDAALTIPAITGAVMFFFLASPVFRRVFEQDALAPELIERFAESTAALVLNGIGSRTGEHG